MSDYCSHIMGYLTDTHGEKFPDYCNIPPQKNKPYCWQHDPERKSPLQKCQAENAKLKEKNSYFASLMQDIRNCSVSEQAQSLLDVRAENIKLTKELEKHRWIPVEERLPEEQGYYQALRIGNRFPTTRQYYNDDGPQWISHDTITHWKPIYPPGETNAEIHRQ